MTVGLYINEPVAIMMSDCLALPTNASGPTFSPSNIEFFDGKNGDLARLVSKFYVADDKTLISFAGNSKHIFEFMEIFPAKWKSRDPSLRPMEFLHQLDYEIRGTYPGWNCSVLGASIIPIEGEEPRYMVNNYASRSENWRFKTNHFGDCFSIGSGAAELRRVIEIADKNMDEYNYPDPNLLFKTLGALNGEAIFSQKGAVEAQTWGGLLQAQIYHPDEGRWLRTPPWLHVCAFYYGSDLRFQGVLKKSVLHTSSQKDFNTSAVITCVEQEGGKAEARIWPVFSPFKSKHETEPINASDIHRKVEFVTITALIFVGNRVTATHRTYAPGQVQGISFEDGNGRYGWKIEPKMLGEWVRQRLMNDPSFRLH